MAESQFGTCPCKLAPHRSFSLARQHPNGLRQRKAGAYGPRKKVKYVREFIEKTLPSSLLLEPQDTHRSEQKTQPHDTSQHDTASGDGDAQPADC